MKDGMLKSLFALAAIGCATPVLGETLVAGAIYFDSENTLLEVDQLIHANDQDHLGRLFTGKHISDKVPANLDIVVLQSGPNPGSPAEFRFIKNPTTYWTYTRYVSNDDIKNITTATAPPTSTSTPPTAPNSTLPANLPSSLYHVTSVPLNPNTTLSTPPISIPTPTPIPTPTATPIPTPTPKPAVVMREREEDSDDDSPAPPLRRHYRVKTHSPSRPPSLDDEVPESEKVWHRVDGHLKWYRKPPKEVRRAFTASEVPMAAPVTVPAPARPPQ
jgi:hypothetical protein